MSDDNDLDSLRKMAKQATSKALNDEARRQAAAKRFAVARAQAGLPLWVSDIKHAIRVENDETLSKQHVCADYRLRPHGHNCLEITHHSNWRNHIASADLSELFLQGGLSWISMLEVYGEELQRLLGDPFKCWCRERKANEDEQSYGAWGYYINFSVSWSS